MNGPSLFDERPVEIPTHAFVRSPSGLCECGRHAGDPVHAKLPDPVPEFDGADYDSALDHDRLTGQIRRVFDVMSDGEWHTLPGIAERTGDPEASISAQLRHLRKPRFGAFIVERRRRGEGGLWEYRMLLPDG